jgi:hypothetical protein
VKKTLLFIVTVALFFAFAAHTMVERSATDVLQQLGIPETLAKDCVWSSLSGASFSYPHTPRLVQTPKGERAAIIQRIGIFAKSYSQSEEFRQRYLEDRESRKPSPPDAPRSMEVLRKEQKEQLQKSIAETETNVKSMPAEQREMMKEVIKTLEEQLKSLNDPNNPMYSKEVEAMQKQGYDAEMIEYRRKVEQWENDYPANPAPMLKRTLSQFLDVSKDVDFNAALVTTGQGGRAFAKPEYESKPSTWKLCFRAGRETVEAARSFAKEWLKELNRTK